MKLRPTFRLHPMVEARLARYISEHPEETEHYRRMVKEYPDHAVKTIMCRKMVQHDELRDLATRLKPLVEQWVRETPGLHDRITAKIQSVRPLYSNIAYVEEALNAKTPQLMKPGVPMLSSPPGACVRTGISTGQT